IQMTVRWLGFLILIGINVWFLLYMVRQFVAVYTQFFEDYIESGKFWLQTHCSCLRPYLRFRGISRDEVRFRWAHVRKIVMSYVSAVKESRGLLSKPDL